MMKLNLVALVAAALTSSMLFAVTTTASAHDERDWERKHWDHRDHRDHRRFERVERVEHIYHREPSRVVYERPVMVMPAPVYQMPSFSQPVDPSLNFNFTIPLR